MGRRKKGRRVSGWVILDKPVGLTSTHAVSRVRRLFDAQKAGHAGTLDPLASGVLPLALGEATKTVPYVMDGEKRYLFTVRWGIETTTDDTEGEASKTSDNRPDEADILANLSQFVGTIAQVPPAFSAKRIDGERAYDLARDGEVVELEASDVQIHDLVYLGSPDADQAMFEAHCGKGTYVRAIARDLGRALGCYGHVTSLRRTQVGPFDEHSTVTLDQLEALNEADGPEACDSLLTPMDNALSDLHLLPVAPGDAAKLRRGMSLLVRGAHAPAHGEEAYAMEGDELVAIGVMDYGKFLPKRVIVAD
ncbi:MAG: tRNA pseudouridine(55) synthase TruB [Devosiaceae bacterium]|nr:tRNA pseudouridine(55) synthase TruB [Devosiaceae bacterium MH13]